MFAPLQPLKSNVHLLMHGHRHNNCLISFYDVQYLEQFMQKYALPEEPGYFLGSEYSYAETVGGPRQQMPCCLTAAYMSATSEPNPQT
jgi:hypothetical protein